MPDRGLSLEYAAHESINYELVFADWSKYHYDPLARFTESAQLKEGATVAEQMRHLLLTKAGLALYAKRKCMVELVFGIIKVILVFRKFSLRGWETIKRELYLVAMVWNLTRMFVLAG